MTHPEPQTTDTAHATKGERLSAEIRSHVERLSAELAKGKTEELVNYLKAMGQFHHYSWGNVLLIFMQRPDAGRVAGFHAWKKFGRHVKKGAKGISILAPIVRKGEENGETVRRVVAVKGATVFSEHDTEGDPLPTLDITSAQGGTPELLHRVIATAAQTFPIEYKDLGGPVGITDGRVIYLDSMKCDADPGTALTTLFHEWAHCVLHVREGQRTEEAQGKSHALIELEAESAAFVLSALHGVDTLPSTNNYIQTYGANPERLFGALESIGHAVRTIMKALRPEAFDEEEQSRGRADAARKSAHKRHQGRRAA